MNSPALRFSLYIALTAMVLAACGEAETADPTPAEQPKVAEKPKAAAEPPKVAADQRPDLTAMPAGTYSVDTSHTSVVWKVPHLGLSHYTARFLTIDGALKFDPDDLNSSQVNISIDPSSIHTGFPKPEEEDFDHVLSKEEIWFNTDEYPEIKFESTSVDLGTGRSGSVTGDLTLLGVTKPVELDVVFNGAIPKKPRTGEAALGFSAVGKIKRSDWGLDTYVGPVGDEVEILIEAEFELAPTTTESE